MDTITGISTPIGSGAISIVRLTGDNAISIALHFFSSSSIKTEKDIKPNKMYLGTFSGDNFKEKCMFVLFRAPRSYTGEDLVELHLHGGVRLTNNVITALVTKGARLATAGEFSRRAFINGKMTLAEAEGVLGLINAESEAEISASYRLMQGVIGKKIKSIAEKLLEVITILSASLDYPDEMADEAQASIEQLLSVKEEIDAFYKTAKTGKLIKNGINVAILGRPNVGKSSLLNALLKSDRAIVTDIAGTTRDTISESLIYQGIKINLLDTAGIRDSVDKIENIGIERAYQAGNLADAIIYLMDICEKITAYDKNILQRYHNKHTLLVYNKSDLCSDKSVRDGYVISAQNGEGIETILDAIVALAEDRRLYGDMLTEERHIYAIQRAKERLEEAINNFGKLSEDCILIDLTACYNALMEIDGGTATEQIIDNIFAKFCVGK